jgi:small subunit ribosomal protein S3
MRKAEVHVQLKPGIIGVRVKLMPPDAQFPDKIKVVEALPTEEKTEESTKEASQEQTQEELTDKQSPDQVAEKKPHEETAEGIVEGKSVEKEEVKE